MLAEVAAQATLQGVTVIGLCLGVLGSRYLSYDLLGRPHGLLRRLVEVLTPTVASTLPWSVLAVLIILLHGIIVPSNAGALDGWSALGVITGIAALAGGLIGLFHGVFADAPAYAGTTRLLSWRGCGKGIVAGLVYFAVVGLILAIPFGPVVGGVAGTAGIWLTPFTGVVGSIWRFTHRAEVDRTNRPRVFSRTGCLTGLIFWSVIFGLAVGIYVTVVTVVNAVQGESTDAISEIVGGLSGVLVLAMFVGGIRWYLRRRPVEALEKQPLWRLGIYMGGLTLGLLLFSYGVFLLVESFTDSDAALGIVGVPIFVAFMLIWLVAAGASIAGGISRFVIWWARNVPERQLGAVGVLLTLVGFLVQLIEPLAHLYRIVP